MCLPATHIDRNKIFIINRSDLEGKLVPDYYNPFITKIEKIVRSKSSKKLKDFSLRFSSGATPLVTEKDKFYSDKESGVPFLRVQNLQVNGKINLDDIKYINYDTHNNYLKRSQVNEGDLLVKITGVGRMAVASVAPDSFEGNTNQHMVVIKIKNKSISQYLATYLNLDIIEKLASRRATGGTRPALDYSALKSIPIIENLDFSILEKAEVIKQKKEALTIELQASIDTYILKELGITLPEKIIGLENRIFKIRFSEITGRRIDPDYNSKYEFIVNQKANYNFVSLKDLLEKPPQYGANEEASEVNSPNDIRYIRITDIDEFGNLKSENWKTAVTTDERYLLNKDDILFARSGSVGRCYIHKQIDKNAIFAGYLIRFVINKKKAFPDFIFHYCNSSIYKFWVSAIERPAVQSNINAEEYKSLPIPLPSIEKQSEMLEHINDIKKKIKQLQDEATSVLENAKQEIEKMILG